MRHRKRTSYLGRKLTARTALLRNLVDSLVEHGRIRTTVTKAKELRRHVEKAVTVGKRGGLHARRLLLSRYPNDNTVNILMSDLSVRFKDREGGYTRIMRMAPRPGDMADMALIEFVDYTPAAGGSTNEVSAEKGGKAAAKGKKSAEKSSEKSAQKSLDTAKKKLGAGRRSQQKKRKRLRRIQNASRVEARA